MKDRIQVDKRVFYHSGRGSGKTRLTQMKSHDQFMLLIYLRWNKRLPGSCRTNRLRKKRRSVLSKWLRRHFDCHHTHRKYK